MLFFSKQGEYVQMDNFFHGGSHDKIMQMQSIQCDAIRSEQLLWRYSSLKELTWHSGFLGNTFVQMNEKEIYSEF